MVGGSLTLSPRPGTPFSISLPLSFPLPLPSLWPSPPMLQAVHMNLIGFVYIFRLWKKYGILESNLTFRFLQEKKNNNNKI